MKQIRKEQTLNTGLKFDSVQDVSDNIHIIAVSNDEVDAAHAVAADILMYDKQEDRKFILKGDTDFSKYPLNRYEPIGIVVIPGSHNVYDTGECGVVSLKEMSCDTPESGSITYPKAMCWGRYNETVGDLSIKIMCPYLERDRTLLSETSTIKYKNSDNAWNIYFPSDYLVDRYINPLNSNEGFAVNTDGSQIYYYMCSPYKQNGDREERYFDSSYKSSILTDFDGKGNTKSIIEQRGTQDYLTWKPIYNNQQHFPAASCCDMYHTKGTNQGNWYLPAAGEFGYLVARYGVINKSISNLNSQYGQTLGIAPLTDYGYSLSTQTRYNTLESHIGWFIGRGDPYTSSHGSRAYVRAFLRFK